MASLKLFTAGHSINGPITYATDESTSYPKENCADFNPDTYWSPTDSSDQYLEFQWSEAPTMEHCVVFLCNYDEITSGTIQVRYYNGSTWIAATAVDAYDETPIRVIDHQTALIGYSRWRVYFLNMPATPQVGMVLWGYKFDSDQGSEWPHNDGQKLHSTTVTGPGGRHLSTRWNTQPVDVLTRQFKIDGSTNMDELKSAHRDSRGRHLPLVFWESSVTTEAKLVRFADDTFYENQTDYQFYEPTVRFVGVPYIQAGQSM